MSAVSALADWAEERGRARGLRGSSGAWLAIWVLAVGYRQLKKFTARQPVVERRVLRPGEQLLISHYEAGAAPPEQVGGTIAEGVGDAVRSITVAATEAAREQAEADARLSRRERRRRRRATRHGDG